MHRRIARVPARDTRRRPWHHWSTRAVALAVALTVLAGATTVAGLAAADPVQDAQQAAQNPQGTAEDPGTTTGDTKFTPVPRSIADAAAAGWQQVAGAVSPAVTDTKAVSEPPPNGMGYSDSETFPAPDLGAGATVRSHTVDFYTVAFPQSSGGNPDKGFAGGAACSDPNATDDQVADCPRVPVIYSYTKAGGWQEAYRGDHPGFVGAIAWLPDQSTAMAVGGTGCYPRREINPPPSSCAPSGSPDKIAGDALVWRFESGSWSSVDVSGVGMTALTALEFSSHPGDCGAVVECGLAGGLGQVWAWKDGRFLTPDQSSLSYKSPVTEFSDRQPPDHPDTCDRNLNGIAVQIGVCTDEPFRIRAIRFNPSFGSSSGPTAVAVTAGCCYQVNDPNGNGLVDDPTVDFPRLMAFQLSGDPPQPQWVTSGLFPGAEPHVASLRDSLYALTDRGPDVSVLLTTGGAQKPSDLSSVVAGPIKINGSTTPGEGGTNIWWPGDIVANSGSGTSETEAPQLSSVHLVAGDGDSGSQAPTVSGQVDPFETGPPAGPDGVIDWAVGEQQRTHQAVAYTTVGSAASAAHVPYPFTCGGLVFASGHLTQCPADTDPNHQAASGYVYSLPSYPLNAFTAVGTTGISWAAGDRGALLTLGGGGASQQLQGATTPPKLGSGQSSALSNRSAYDSFRQPLAGEIGPVPPLASQPLRELSAGSLTPAGSPNPRNAKNAGVVSMAMSRDGSEGWAVGDGLFHFDGTRWTECDPGAGPCAGLAGLGDSAKFLTIARVPLENGSDPAQADDFEAIAVVQTPDGLEFARYRQGSWSVVDGWALPGKLESGADLAFGAPDDGWLVTYQDNTHQNLWRLSAGGWTSCSSVDGNPAGCDDTTSGILPTTATTAKGNQTDYYTAAGQTIHLLSVGRDVYLYGTRGQGVGTSTNVGGTGAQSASTPYPFVLRHDPDGKKWDQELDPDPIDNPSSTPDSAQKGILQSLSLVQNGDKVEGWGIGDFPPTTTAGVDPNNPALRVSNFGHTPLLRVDSSGWNVVQNPSPAAWEYLLPQSLQRGTDTAGKQVLAATGSAPVAYSTQAATWLNPATGRWEVFPAPFSGSDLSAATPDNRGGYWFAAHPNPFGPTWFYHYSKSVHTPVFSDVPHPIRQPITAAAGGGDGSYWVATASGTVYRYDRVTGWDQVPVKGWDTGGAVQSPAFAIAVGSDGTGLVVGKQGRIADITPQGVHLDPAAVTCSSNPDSCGGGRTLRAAAVAPDGSALAGGDQLALLYRTAGGSFATIAPPQASQGAAITGISMPAPDRAWLTTSTGDVFAGSLSGGHWDWAREDVDSSGRLLTGGDALRAIAVDASGNGYAVGENGLILKRSAGDAQPWSRVDSGYGDDLWSVTLGPGGKGALVGGDAGLVLTLAGSHFEVARPSDFYDPLGQPEAGHAFSQVVGVAILPGYKDGDVEAWAAVEGETPAILHYANDASNPLLGAGAGLAAPNPDAPQHDAGEFDIAAFGKSDCPSGDVCPEFTGSERQNEVIADRVRDSLLSDGNRPDVAVFTGDVSNTAGYRNGRLATGPTDESRIHERWAELIADPLARAGVPVYGAPGGEDLSSHQACPVIQLPNGTSCVSTHQARAGLNLAWRLALAGQDAPWGGRDPSSTTGLQFEEVGGGTTDPAVDTGKAGGAAALPTGSTPGTGARTHYALDVVRGGKKLVRLVVVDTSLKTLAGTAGLQNPVQDQLTWLHDVLANRPVDERAIVVSETPSYTYDPSAGGTTDTLTDSAAFEALMVQDHVSGVISGRLGWNGLYWTVAPGLHCPRPGDSYEPDPPGDPTRCVASGALDTADQLAASLQGLGAPAPVPGVSLPQPSQVVKDNSSALAPIPFLVAASAGGQFGPQGGVNGTAAQGFWHGYSLLRLFGDGRVAIEQRPVFDWIGIQAQDHAITPGHRMRLKGYGREPVGSDQPARYDDISGPAVTHRYDLVSADPQHPWQPQVDPALKGPDNPNGYVPVPESIGASVDPQTGDVGYTGSGNHPPFYAIAILSVKDKAATWPLVFEPRPSFKITPPVVHNVVVPAVRVAAAAAAALPQPPSAPIPKPPSLNLTFPQPPSLPSLSLNAPQAQAPPPPAPPPPPASATATALQISPAPAGLNVAPQATVIPPPAPPVQPAPPSGARREARQRQAAVAKSEEGGGQEGAAQEQGDGDAKGGARAASSRLELRRDDFAFTAHHGGGSASAWPRDLLYGGGLGVAALVLALGWGIAGPRPRRREPELPAPAWARRKDGR